MQSWAEDLNNYFSKENRCMGNRFLKSVSTPVAIREVEVQTATRQPLPRVSTAVLKRAPQAAVQAEAVAGAAALNRAEEHVVNGAHGALQLQQARVLRRAGTPGEVTDG